jgi:predicted DNA repair protein MutK
MNKNSWAEFEQQHQKKIDRIMRKHNRIMACTLASSFVFGILAIAQPSKLAKGLFIAGTFANMLVAGSCVIQTQNAIKHSIKVAELENTLIKGCDR